VDAREARPQSVGALTPPVPFEPILTDPGRLAFRRYENASLSYTGIDSHTNLTQVGGWDTIKAR
jgi:hypothetical protein